MKKVGIGCLVVAVVLLIACWVGVKFAMQKARTFVASYEQLQEIPALNRQIRNQSAFAPPENGRLEAGQVERFMAVQTGMRTRLGEHIQQLDAKYSQLSGELKQQGREASIGESLGAVNDLLGMLMEAKRAQVDALNESGFSLGEYQWVRQQTLLALGQGLAGFNLEALAGNPAAAGSVLAVPANQDPQMLEQNRALLKPYEESMDQWLTLVFFGL